jgi:uncharacterized protein
VLTAELVRVRKKGTELEVIALSRSQRARAEELAEELLALAGAAVGGTRAELAEAWATLGTKASEQKLVLGLQKLLEDRMDFEADGELDARALRSDVFLRAAEARRAAGSEGWDRAAFLAAEAAKLSLSDDALLRALYSDLRHAQRIQGFRAIDAHPLVAEYELAQQQAVLLKAVHVLADVRCADAYAYRALFRKLKFLRLLHRIEARADGGYRIAIDGPFSLFGPSTKYGLELALALPSLLACDSHQIVATLRWGKERTPLTYRIEGEHKPVRGRDEPLLPDDVQQLLERFRALDSEWDAEAASDILEVPGFGMCVPDLRFVHRSTGEIVHLEVLGYWSREAVWRRVELAQQGLGARVIFAVSARLRVSEEVLPDEVPSELYVYKGALLPKEVLRRLEQSAP